MVHLKQVRFTIDPTKTDAASYCITDGNGPELGEPLWYQSYDYDQFKGGARRLCREARQKEHRFEEMFSKGLESTSNKDLKNWTVKFPSLRGLEQWASLRHGQKRRIQQQRTISSVLQAQRMLQNVSDADTVVTSLARISQEHSESAKVLAILLGNADEYAVAHIDGISRSRRKKTQSYLSYKCFDQPHASIPEIYQPGIKFIPLGRRR